MELLQSLFENAELPTDFKEKTTTLFEAAVDEKVKTQLTQIQESYDNKLNEAKEAFIAESIATIDSVVEETVLEWAKENAVALDSEIKGQIAESFLQGLKGVFEKADIELNGDTAGKELVKLQEQNATLEKQVVETKQALVESEQKLVNIKIKEIIEQVTEGLADTQSHRVAKLCEAFDFKSEDDYRAKVALVVEAITGAPLKQEAKGKLQPNTPLAGELNDPGVGAVGYSPSNKAGKVTGTVDVGGTKAPVDGKKTVTDTVDDESGESPVDTLVTKPKGAANKSAEGDKGLPIQEVYDNLRDQYAPHIQSDMVAETLKLFK